MDYTPFSLDLNSVQAAETLPVEWFGVEPVPLESRVRLGYGSTAKEYLDSGLRDVSQMLDILTKLGFTLPEQSSILDFGCGGGRMLRHLPERLPNCEYWGCDSEARAIAWAQVYLRSSFRLFTNIREPHLPFADSLFDFIYAGSVFSHLNDMAEMWMLELRRIAKPNSVLYLTFQDDSSLKTIQAKSTDGTRHYFKSLFADQDACAMLPTDYKRMTIGRNQYSSQVFYNTEWLESLLKSFFSVVKLQPNAYGWQTAAILSP